MEATGRKLSEKEEAVILAHRLLDEPNADPDDDLRTLARQFLRATERVTALEKFLEDAPDHDSREEPRDFVVRYNQWFAKDRYDMLPD